MTCADGSLANGNCNPGVMVLIYSVRQNEGSKICALSGDFKVGMIKSGEVRAVSYIVLLCAVLAGPAVGQGVSGPDSISGTVTDPTGAGIPDADVLVQQRGTKASVAATRTDNLGKFQLAGLPTGPLEIIVSHEGFASETVRVAIRNRAPAPLHIQLQLAGVHQTVTVTGSVAAKPPRRLQLSGRFEF